VSASRWARVEEDGCAGLGVWVVVVVEVVVVVVVMVMVVVVVVVMVVVVVVIVRLCGVRYTVYAGCGMRVVVKGWESKKLWVASMMRGWRLEGRK
jgi:hypothetical protein